MEEQKKPSFLDNLLAKAKAILAWWQKTHPEKLVIEAVADFEKALATNPYNSAPTRITALGDCRLCFRSDKTLIELPLEGAVLEEFDHSLTALPYRITTKAITADAASMRDFLRKRSAIPHGHKEETLPNLWLHRYGQDNRLWLENLVVRNEETPRVNSDKTWTITNAILEGSTHNQLTFYKSVQEWLTNAPKPIGDSQSGQVVS